MSGREGLAALKTNHGNIFSLPGGGDTTGGLGVLFQTFREDIVGDVIFFREINTDGIEVGCVGIHAVSATGETAHVGAIGREIMAFARAPVAADLQENGDDGGEGAAGEDELLPQGRGGMDAAFSDDLFFQTFRDGDLFELGAERDVERAMVSEPPLQFGVALSEFERFGEGGVAGIGGARPIQFQYFFCFVDTHGCLSRWPSRSPRVRMVCN